MSEFFVRRPIVAIVIAILMTLIGGVCILALPIAQYPQIAPPEIQVQTHFTGADALTIEQSVAAPIEQQMSGVDNMNYMYSINANSGDIRLIVDFDIATDPNIDQVLTQLRVSQAQSQLPVDVNNYGVTVKKSTTAPLMLIALYSPKGTYDGVFLANYSYINLVDQLTRVPGIGNVQVFGAGQYAMRLWVKPDQLAKLGITVPDIITAIQKQNTVNPAGQVGGEPIPSGQKFTYTVRAQGRLQTPEEFGEIVVRANADGSFVRVKDIARIDLGAQTYNLKGRLNGQPSAIVACYQLPGTNAVKAAQGVRQVMAEARQRFPADMDFAVSLDQTLSVTEGMREILKTLFEALALVVLVVFIFLQGWRATLIPLCAVPVSLIGTFVLFPLFGFSINTLSLFGLVLAIGLVVDDAIVVVEAVERHIEEGMSPRDATLQAMREVSGPVIGIALVLSAVFIPTAFLQRAFTQSGALIVAAAAAKENARPARLVLRPVQSSLWQRDERVHKLVAPGHSKSGSQFRIARHARGGCGTVWIAIAEWIPAGRRSRLRLSRASITRRIVTRTYRPGCAQDRRHSQQNSRRSVHHQRRRIQFAQSRAKYLQRVLLRHVQALERTDQARRTIHGHQSEH
jgi:HAE1 family hydrophobic/amphiphilic exporter-1